MTAEQIQNIIVSVLIELLACGGFWQFVLKKADRKSNKTKMLLGLGHDRIMSLGLKYIARGHITSDEFENLNEYLYQPYVDMGGNGTAKRIMDEVKKLPIKDNNKGE